MSDKACIFCAIGEQSIPADIVMKNDHVIVIKDIAPKAPAHYLIIPKKHVADISSLDLADMSLASHLFKAAQELASHLTGSQSFRLLINNGADAGQSVFHLHVHFLSGKKMTDF